MKLSGSVVLLGICAVKLNVLGASAFVLQPKGNTVWVGGTPALFSLPVRSTNADVTSRGDLARSQAGMAPARPVPGGPVIDRNRMDATEQPSFKDIWNSLAPITVQGAGALRTWSMPNDQIEFAQILMKTDGGSLNTKIDLWQGPNNTPQKNSIYVGYGQKRPIRLIMATPKGSNTIGIRNVGPLEYPVQTCVEPDFDNSANLAGLVVSLSDMTRIIQGGSTKIYPFGSDISSVAVLITTDGRPCNATLELLQGPNSIKISMEHYVEDGNLRPLFVIFQTPGSENSVRIVNSAPTEFPLSAAVVPFRFGPDEYTMP